MRGLDFSSWQAVLTTLFGLVVITLIGVGVRLIVMQTVQQRRERENRQINERLRTLIAAYKTLGGSFSGDLSVDPTHLRDLRRRSEFSAGPGVDLVDNDVASDAAASPALIADSSSDRSRRIRDAVEAALSDILLLGTDEQVRLAARAAGEMAAGRPVHTAELVVSLRDFIRRVLDLEPVPADLSIPQQGPTRPSGTKGKGDGGGGRDGKGEGGRGGGAGAGGGAAGAGMGLGVLMAGDSEQDSSR